MANKITYGLSNAHVWPITSTSDAGVPNYGAIINLPGATELSLVLQIFLNFLFLKFYIKPVGFPCICSCPKFVFCSVYQCHECMGNNPPPWISAVFSENPYRL